MLKKLLFLCALLMLTALPAQAAVKKLVAASDCTWPPMEFVDQNKHLTGYAIEYLAAISKETGVEIETRNVAWDGIFPGLIAGRYDLVASSVTITEERKKTMDFSIPYFEVHQAVILPKESKAATVEALKGMTLGAQIGTTGFFAISKIQGVTPRSYDEISQAVEALYSGRISGVVCDDPVAADFALQNKVYAEKLKIAFILPTEEKEYYGFAVKKGNQEVLDILNQGVDKVKSNGTEARLRKKWMGQ
ncbi:MAG: basic amino acid ABC transporter substrate-binding protein [Deltaproteobacteria bacterium]|jgi:polar amino acid transport system substrate-binding protein|nr:basic amino acid ABC transporter substrate-binding protein [Deltaproteobacteria bacterium]